jgi:hypothetical protein
MYSIHWSTIVCYLEESMTDVVKCIENDIPSKDQFIQLVLPVLRSKLKTYINHKIADMIPEIEKEVDQTIDDYIPEQADEIVNASINGSIESIVKYICEKNLV